MNKPVLAAIFAHPDDETLGPGGTLALYSKTHDVYVICATPGDAGENHLNGDKKNIAFIREKELLNSAKILGIKKVFFLKYHDGTLSNNLYHEIVKDIEAILKKVKPQTLLTFEERGVSGHIDHVAITLVVQYLFYRKNYAQKLMLYCVSETESKLVKDYFIYFPKGYTRSEVDKIIDIASVQEVKKRAMYEHKSQMKDVKMLLEIKAQIPAEEYFLVRKR